ncbi:MAG: Fe-S cluster assembly protein SufD [Betaproteobacteria bacterium]|nr:Fe-S cluster assembly protein SufD [Betaproteobacteria bacterium]MDE2132619.1 Fe-S cluster assembly protein SufD [Betaproteobacteria bacterium]MDE2212326.1 Fe-S cluster assembly protein SufD [Betaproteobacteria bacterium]MDE2623808.1 Fe-S cluster assembly protein SufD [Betaproteobacteria bacterium]
MSTAIAHYQSEFERLGSLLPWQDSPQWQEWRRSGWAHFASLGFPTTRHEEWKYTSLAALEKLALSCAPAAPEAPQPTWDSLKARAVLPQARYRAVFVDGRFSPQLSQLDGLPAGIAVRPLSALSVRDSLGLQVPLQAVRARTPFAGLNAAFMAEGAWITAAAEASLDDPLLILYVTTRGGQAQHVVNAYHLAAGSRVAVAEQYLGLTDEAYFVNQVAGVRLETGAQLSHVKLQQEGGRAYHIGALQASQQGGSRFESHSFALSGAFGRNDMETALLEPGASVVMNGLYRVASREFQDFHTCIRHESPDCTSDEYFKGVLDGSGRAVFNGKIVVAQDAQHTASRQSNHNLLLSDQAEVDTKPQLEIFADDVKCSHGATVGQLDEAQLFYLRSRGLDPDHARTLLIEAFALDLLSSIGHAELRAAMDHLMRGHAHV